MMQGLLQFWVLAASTYLVLPSLTPNPKSLLAYSSNWKASFNDAKDLPMITVIRISHKLDQLIEYGVSCLYAWFSNCIFQSYIQK
jgi:hypothetical protein